MKIPLYTSEDVALLTATNIESVRKYAQKHINYVGGGHRKIYIWFEDDIASFKKRNTKRGRPKIN